MEIVIMRFFADDSIFFTRASVEECTRLHNILGKYCRCSGQVLNFGKSEIFFSPNVESRLRNDIISKLYVREAPQQTTYPGLPSIIGRKKQCVFQAIINKVRKKIAGWKERNLSIAGKEVMLKSVAQAMPMYVMNIFMLLDESINEIHRAFNRYWWGNGNKENPIRWAFWERMCISKSRGGMGFRHMKAFNKALLAKQCWRLITMEYSLPARILKARYFPRCSVFTGSVGGFPGSNNDQTTS
ncbi:hypothetical protein Tco_0115116 [Tanacetum coccineum]